MITDVDEYFINGCGRCERFSTPECSARLWHNGLLELRRICLDSGLKETAKWGQPCYMYETRNIVIIGAFQKDFRLSFFNASLMRDPEGILERSGPNTQHPGIIRFTATGDVLEKEGIIHAYIQEAIEYVKSGVQPKKQIEALVLPIELEEALACIAGFPARNWVDNF